MKFVDEYRGAEATHALAAVIARTVTRPWTIMEICGGQTHSIVKFGLDELLPASITLVHGPGCPVCVTPVELIDAAVTLAAARSATCCACPAPAPICSPPAPGAAMCAWCTRHSTP
jgi:hydrogenase expression/formation protein HypD